MAGRSATQNDFSLNNEANYDNGLNLRGTLRFLSSRSCRSPSVHFRRRARFHRAGECRAYGAFAIGIIDDRESFANRERFPMARESTPVLKNRLRRSSRVPHYLVIVTRATRHMHVLRWAVERRRATWNDWQQAQSSVRLSRLEKDGIAQRSSRACMRRWASTLARSHRGNCHQHTAELIAIRGAPQISPTGRESRSATPASVV